MSFSRFPVISALLLVVIGIPALVGCDQAKSVRDAADIALNPPDRQPIDVGRTGVNNFFLDGQIFGSTDAQYADISNNLQIKHVRFLVPWITASQPSPSASPSFGFSDNVLLSIPPGVDVLVVVAHTPDWMANPSNWIEGNPRKTWVEKWLKPVLQRYRNVPGIVGWEIWNEPDAVTIPSDGALELSVAENYMELLSLAAPVVRALNPGKFILPAATSSIQQDFPNHLNFNKRLRDLGAEQLVDVWNVHFYGKQYERVVGKKGVADFLNSLSLPIWITESGQQGPNNQLDYVERTWGFLRDEVPAIDRIYYYQYASTDPLQQNYGLRTNDQSFPVSDLYLSLRAGR